FVEQSYESQTYPRFTDVLYDIEKLNPRPDFILIGGDNVEYNNTRWLEDFKSITEGYTARTGIGIYFVPGNHDRYDSESSAFQSGQTDISGGNDYLKNYFEVMKDSPRGVISLFKDDESIMDDEISREGGYNKYNYYFNHKGFQIIGLDSGEDTGQWDQTPESEGFNINTLEELDNLATRYSSVPKIVFMHNTVWNDKGSGEFEDGNIFGGVIIPDGAISNNWTKFITYCDENTVSLVLSGHTHDSIVFDLLGNKIELSDWTKNKNYPLYLQTQSAGKDDNGWGHGYRIIDIKNGKAIPQEPREDITKYEKVYTDLNGNDEMKYESYSSSGEKMTLEDSGDFTLFAADSPGGSDRKIIYDDTDYSKFKILNKGASESSYDFFMQKREQGAEPGKQLIGLAYGYHIHNPELCSAYNLYCPSLIAVIEGSGYRSLFLKDIKTKGNSSDDITINWDEVETNTVFPSTEIRGLELGINGNNETSYGYFKVLMAVDLNSPGELRVVDSEGNVTGLVDGEIVEDIPYSIYVPESETVYVFGNSNEDIKDLKTQVVGSYEATYDLTLSLSENSEEKTKFAADNILTDNQTIHQFGVDWDVLSQGGKGVTMEFDEDGIEGFERDITSDGSLSFPKAVLDKVKYEASEGAEVIFDASGSSDSDGSIMLYEWDFNGDGNYDASSAGPTISHVYGDDYSGKVFLRVTDDEGLTDRSSIANADVLIANTDPSVSILKFDIADTFDRFILEGDFTDAGWLDTHTASIDWGDGSTDDISVLTEENSYTDATGKVSASHRYAKPENYVVKLTVTDDEGGISASEITLESPRRIRQAVFSKLGTIWTEDEDAMKELDQSLTSLEESLTDEYWQDDFHLDTILMNKFFSLDQKAVKSLEKIIGGEKKYMDFESPQDIQDILVELNQSNVFLAKIMVYETGSLEAKDLKSAKEWVEKMLEF
ncbi:MAG: PKD domain-containing protein, partial [Candidatus Pacebacteria bacterium]|nr:PKD domain-containing protein [Candidatus Paceibacterota bacterium]